MATIEREFYREARGPAPEDVDTWRLIFDQSCARLLVCHEWQTARHAGVDEFAIDDFLAEKGAAPEALRVLLFGEVAADV
ncbi:hypothetical protein [Bradyrhizobium sp. 2TAF24]|uniref:hypothetical protein n=1 Tax=Bradyrhizobium sp. 2TAF24 TaxID=3233011 RepID=UPI003F921FDE